MTRFFRPDRRVNRLSVFLTLALWAISASCRTTGESPDHRCGCAKGEPNADLQEAVVSIAVHPSTCAPSQFELIQGNQTNLVFALWADGRVQWSEHSRKGGPPYHEMRIDPRAAHEIARFLGLLVDSIEGPKAFRVDDVSQTVLRVRDKFLASGHELAETPGRYVNQDGFVSVPDYGEPKAAEATWSPQYAEFRRAWRRFRERCEWVVLKGADATFD